jgi:hypothetical protein
MADCKECGQPMLPPGVKKLPNEYDHASGCPLAPEHVSEARLQELRELHALAKPNEGDRWSFGCRNELWDDDDQEYVTAACNALPTLLEEVSRLQALINNPRFDDFIEAVRIEAAHQRERWGDEHDEKKTPEDWFWTLGYLAGKAIRAEGDKRLHHVITSGALLFNWFLHLTNGTVRADSERIPQAVAEALDCIDREEDEVGMHRKLIDNWRREKRGG